MFRLCDHREQFHSVVARIDKKKNHPNHKQILNNNNFRHLKCNESFTGIFIKKKHHPKQRIVVLSFFITDNSSNMQLSNTLENTTLA